MCRCVMHDAVQTWSRRRRLRQVERLRCRASCFHKDDVRRTVVWIRSHRAVCPHTQSCMSPNGTHSELYVPGYHILVRRRVIASPRRLPPVPALTWRSLDSRQKWRHDDVTGDDEADDVDTRPRHYSELLQLLVAVRSLRKHRKLPKAKNAESS